jgi:hypothetical protein
LCPRCCRCSSKIRLDPCPSRPSLNRINAGLRCPT